MHRCVDDLKCDKRRQFEILQADADLGGTLADQADARCGGDDFVDTARALDAILDGELKRQPADRRKWVSVKLQRASPSQERDQKRPSVVVTHPEPRKVRQLAELGGQPFEPIFVDLEHQHHMIQITIHSKSRGSHVEPLEQSQLADFRRQRRELVVFSLCVTLGSDQKKSLQWLLAYIEALESRKSSGGSDVNKFTPS